METPPSRDSAEISQMEHVRYSEPQVLSCAKTLANDDENYRMRCLVCNGRCHRRTTPWEVGRILGTLMGTLLHVGAGGIADRNARCIAEN